MYDYIYMSIYIYLSVYIYIFEYIYMIIYMIVYTIIYIYIHVHRWIIADNDASTFCCHGKLPFNSASQTFQGRYLEPPSGQPGQGAIFGTHILRFSSWESSNRNM